MSLRRVNLIALLAVACGLAGVEAWAQESSAAPPEPCISLQASLPGGDADAQKPAFSASQVTDVVITALIPSQLGGGLELELRFSTPRGGLYRSMPVLVGKPRMPAGERMVRDYPWPLKEKAPAQTTLNGVQYLKVTATLPVGGTDIVTSSIYGSWSVEVRLGGRARTCKGPLRFTITQ